MDDEFDETCDISSDIEQETAEIEEDMTDTEIVEDDGDIHWTDDGVNYTVCQDACDEKDVEFLDENTSEEVSTGNNRRNGRNGRVNLRKMLFWTKNSNNLAMTILVLSMERCSTMMIQTI